MYFFINTFHRQRRHLAQFYALLPYSANKEWNRFKTFSL
jgi:hypothetical protein